MSLHTESRDMLELEQHGGAIADLLRKPFSSKYRSFDA